MIDTWKARARDLSCGVFRGFRAADGRFEEDAIGPLWIAFEEQNDVVLWTPYRNEVARLDNRAFALNEKAIGNATTYALDDRLRIHGSVASWILAGGNGIFVTDWRFAFDKLRDAPRIDLDADLRSIYARSMRCRLPHVTIRQVERSAA